MCREEQDSKYIYMYYTYIYIIYILYILSLYIYIIYISPHTPISFEDHLGSYRRSVTPWRTSRCSGHRWPGLSCLPWWPAILPIFGRCIPCWRCLERFWCYGIFDEISVFFLNWYFFYCSDIFECYVLFKWYLR